MAKINSDNTQEQLVEILKQDPIEYQGKRCHYPHPSWYKGQSEALTKLIESKQVEAVVEFHEASGLMSTRRNLMPTNKVDKSIDAVLRYVWFLGADNDPNPKLRAQAKADLKKLVMGSLPTRLSPLASKMVGRSEREVGMTIGYNDCLKEVGQVLKELFDGSL